MSIGLVTIAALLLLLPGIGFIAGVSFADKNVREIVFRNTPAEIGYVVIVSSVVHLVFTVFVHFNIADLYVVCLRFGTPASSVPLALALSVLRISLCYCLLTAAVGFAVGSLLGRLVRRGGFWTFFAKHAWMLDLAGDRDKYTIYGRVLLKQKFKTDGDSAEYMIVIEGIIRDSYFAADGTLLYLVLSRFTELKIPAAEPPYLGVFVGVGERRGPTDSDQLLIEGREIAMARYRSIPIGSALTAEGLDQITRAAEQNGE